MLPENNEFLGEMNKKLAEIKMIEFNQDSSVTPQIIQMTNCVDFALSEIKIIFTRVIDELVASQFDIFEKEQQINGFRQARPASSATILTESRKLSEFDEQKFEELEMIEKEQQEHELTIQKREIELNEKAEHIKEFESNLLAQAQDLEVNAKKIKESESDLSKEKRELETKRKEVEDKLAELNVLIIQNKQNLEASKIANPGKQLENSVKNIVKEIDGKSTSSVEDDLSNSIIKEDSIIIKRKENDLEKKYQADLQKYKTQIE